MNSTDANITPTWIAIQGGSCAGKTTLANALAHRVGASKTLSICLDLFYFPFERNPKNPKGSWHNFDDPIACDWARLRRACRRLISGHSAIIPRYDYVSGQSIGGNRIEPLPYIIIEGLWPFEDRFLLDLCKLRVFVDAPPDVRLVRRLRRDLLEGTRGWSLDEALAYYMQCTKPMHEIHVEPGKQVADLLVSGEEGLDESVESIFDALGKRSSI